MTYGNASLITVNVGKNQTGYVRITVIGTDINSIVEIRNGVAKLNTTLLDVGHYRVNVTYLGDATFHSSVNQTTLTVNKAELYANVTALDVTVKDNITFIVNSLNKTFAGKVKITVDGKTYGGDVKSLIQMGKLMADTYINCKL